MDIHTFFERQAEALGFKDVRLETGYSNVLPAKADITSKFSKRIELKAPLCSAAMDTVTESEMAIALALQGGIGVIHKNFGTPEEQAWQVAKVKHYLAGKVANPKTVEPDDRVKEVESRCRDRGYKFRSFPVEDDQKRVIGVVTSGSFKFCSNPEALVRDIMEKPITAKPSTSPDEAIVLMAENKKGVLPLVDDEGHLQGMYVYSDVIRNREGKSASFCTDNQGRLRVAAAIGTDLEDAAERMDLLCQEGVDAVVIDTAHGYSEPVKRVLKSIKENSRFNNIDVVAGNVSTAEAAKWLAECGADAIKVGQGPGSICTTRIIAGVGCPQVTAIYEASRLTKKGVPIIADGGIEHSGDITIAMSVGANCVMIGNLFAGTKQAPGEMFLADGMQWKAYRGMGSLGAMKVSKASRERYLQASSEKLVPEGVEGRVPYRGDVNVVIDQLIGGLRAGMGYTGSSNIAALQSGAIIIKISSGGLSESHIHNVTMTKNPPNYERY